MYVLLLYCVLIISCRALVIMLVQELSRIKNNDVCCSFRVVRSPIQPFNQKTTGNAETEAGAELVLRTIFIMYVLPTVLPVPTYSGPTAYSLEREYVSTSLASPQKYASSQNKNNAFFSFFLAPCSS
jgi:hypothetical protein